ncbi:YihE protein, required for LPS synthesis [hydrothermal vent metagenome]|uniref:YihE protein, required for LPS synthesis n=1 Tax=hydrothermal vent metagenome TaxID=652676 RepID=A0A3B1AZ95_9ZZZZ
MNEVSAHPYQSLTPDLILDALENQGYLCDGRLLPLNSYENRVYQVGVEDARPVVVKFYRPGRWSDEAIMEEHAFSKVLAEAEIPVVAPLAGQAGETLHQYDGFRFSVSPNCGGRWQELDEPAHIEWMGRLIARIHALGRVERFQYRQTLDIEQRGTESYRYILENGFIPYELEAAYQSLLEALIPRIQGAFEAAGSVAMIRLHGDCHLGNVLWTDAGPHFVDFDDCCMGPAIQDLWMLLSGEVAHRTAQLSYLLDAYSEFNDFDARELHLIEALRTLRMIHYSAWLARRWSDPAFPANFPWFNSQKYWEEQILSLKEQMSLLDEPPLQWG